MFKKDKNDKVINEPNDTVHEWSNSMDAIRYAFSEYAQSSEDDILDTNETDW
jgi:hypothetical protein